jgi:enoyl-CoA hydratase/carnithine racemase
VDDCGGDHPEGAMTENRVTITIDAGVAEVVLNRPDKLNAWDRAMFDAVSAAGERLRAEPGLRAVILSGAGRGFSAGLDTSSFADGAQGLEILRAELLQTVHGTASNRFQHPCTVWADVPVPVIAALHGPVYGAGLQLALGADLRIAAPSAGLSVMEVKWGLIPDMGVTRLLPRLMPADRALELMVTARVVDGAEAAALGLVTRVADEPLTEARALARAIAGRNPDAIRGMKALVGAAWPGGAGHLTLEARLQEAILGSPNQIEAVMAEMQKRPPRFS